MRKRATLVYNFTSLSDMVKLLGSFHGPIDVRNDMREACRKRRLQIDRVNVTARVEVEMTQDIPEKTRSHE